MLDSHLLWFLVSFALSLCFGSLLFFVTRRREAYLQHISAEAGFWIRLGVPQGMVEAVRRLEESRFFIGLLWLIVMSQLLMSLAFGGSYLYFKV